ncbi:transposase [Alkalibacterium sp. 20]|uniref:transposase n=1 Tax=Alkalibacterium sp. 20 TaxID=1798803 RepID=UPI000A815E58
MLAYDEELETTYRVYQSIINAVEENDHKCLESIVTQSYSSELSSYMKTSLKTLRKHLKLINNTFNYPYNNGRIEGINNKIKVLNRVAYGYRNFINYKNRIILHFNLKPTKAKVNKKKKVNTKAA